MLPARRCNKALPRIAQHAAASRKLSSTSNHQQSSDNVVRSPYTDVHVPELNLSEYIWRNADRWKHWPALTCSVTGRSVTYGEARASSERLSLSLPATVGLKPGDTIGLVLPNMPEFPLALLGAMAAGLVVSPANPIYTAEELARQFTDSSARAVVTTPALLDKVRAAVDKIPGGAQLIVATDGGAEETALASRGTELSLRELLAREYTRRTPRGPRPDPDGLAALPYSSGTTGLPKGVMLTHRNLVANLCQMEHKDILGILPHGSPQDVTLAVLPFFHIYGLNGLLNVSLSIGRHVVCIPRFEAANFAACFTRYKPSVLCLVPPLLVFLSNCKDVQPADLARVRFVTCGAAPATRKLIEEFVRRANNPTLDFREGFGMTETSCMATFTPQWAGLSKVGSCGAPVPQTDMRVVGQDGSNLGPHCEGELLIRGPQVMKGYLNNEKATRETMSEDGWLRTGDVAYYDEENYIYLVDRMKELIKVKGLQVSPTELEGVICGLEGVADVAVIGVADERSGEVPRAFVIRKEGSTISENDVASFVEARVAPFKKLAGGVRFVTAIPKNAGGKTLRKELKKFD